MNEFQQEFNHYAQKECPTSPSVGIIVIELVLFSSTMEIYHQLLWKISAPPLIPRLATPPLSLQQQQWLTPCSLVWFPHVDNSRGAAKLRLETSSLFAVRGSRTCT